MDQANTTRSGAATASRYRPERLAYVPEIDSLRAFAMTAVVLQHSGLLPFGWMGVWLFFVISGFAITTSMLNSESLIADKWLALRNFMARRAIRIWPLYFAFLGVAVAVILVTGNHAPLEELPYLATFTFNLKMILTQYTPEAPLFGMFGHLWTISVEEQFYLLFPFLFIFLRREQLIFSLALLIGLAIALRVALGPALDASGLDEGRRFFAVYALSLAHFDAFALGALLALYRGAFERDARLAFGLMGLGLAIAAAHCAYFVGLNVAETGRFSIEALKGVISGGAWGEGRHVTQYLAATVPAAGLIALILAGNRVIKALCAPAALQWIGRVSYGAYVLHVIALGALYDWLLPALAPELSGLAKGAVTFAIGYPATLAMAALSHRYLEQRFLALRHRFA